MKRSFPLISALVLSGCASAPAASSPDPQAVFFENVRSLCGQAFEGTVTTTDAADEAFRQVRLVAHFRDCEQADEIGIPFGVGQERSRRWVLSRTETGLRLKHDHRDPEGVPHGFHMYGGDAREPGETWRQEFPADQESIDQFLAGDAEVSTSNVWAMEMRPGEVFVYELSRPGRHLRIEFDLTRPVDP